MPNIPPIKRKSDDEDKYGRGLRDAPPVVIDDRPEWKGHKVGVPPGTREQFNPIAPPSMKRGGMVKRTALYRLHSGERVLPKSMARRYSEEKHGGKMDAGCR